MLTPRHFIRLFLGALLILICWQNVFSQELDDTPLSITARLFQASGPIGTRVSNQLFRLRTPTSADDESWLSNIRKAYPNTDISLLQVYQFRSYRKPKPFIITLGDSKQTHCEIHIMTAYGLNDKDQVGNTVISEINVYQGAKTATSIPTSLGNQGFEAQVGMTYFYTQDEINLTGSTYAKFLREGNDSPVFQKSTNYLIISLTIEPDDPPKMTFDQKSSEELQNQATKKAAPEWVPEITQNNLAGKILVKVEIGPEGKVTRANIWRSTVPEGNSQAVTAAKQWEFQAGALAEKTKPITAYLTFIVDPKAKPKNDSEAKK